MPDFGLREKKPALLKLALLDEVLHLLQSKGLYEISVDELCANVNTTKVTFFKYFSHKEQILDYFIQKWLYDRSYEIYGRNFRGREGIIHIFRTISADMPLNKKIMISLIHYYSKLTKEPETIEISACEYYLFNEEAFMHQVKPMNLCEIFSHYLSEIDGIDPALLNDIISQLIALMYGVPVQTHIMREEDMFPFYEMGVKSILDSRVI